MKLSKVRSIVMLLPDAHFHLSEIGGGWFNSSLIIVDRPLSVVS